MALSSTAVFKKSIKNQPFLATFCFVYPYEVAMPSRQNVRNAWSRALRALETPEEKLVRREIRNEKDRARRRRAKTKQKQVAK